jgi:glycosyltransferase involved in cell wall biosynthesis
VARVCSVAFSYYATDTRVRRAAETLVRRGHEVDVICVRARGRNNERMLAGVRIFALPALWYRGSNPVLYVTHYLVFFALASALVVALNARRRIDVLHVNTMPDFLAFVGAVPKLFGVKLVLDVHDLMPELYASKFGVERTHWMIRLLTWVERRSIAFADRAIAVHEPHLNALVRHGNPRERFAVVINSPDEEYFTRQPRPTPDPARPFTLVYHGSIDERHGLAVAVRATALAVNEGVNLSFRIIGEGEGCAEVERLVGELGLEDVVHISPPVPLDQLVPRIADADLGVVPLRNDSFTRTMLPVKLLEYVALGIPVVCSDTPAIRAYFDGTMVCFSPAGDAETLARNIVALARDDARRAALADRAGSFIERFGWKLQGPAYGELIEELAEERQGARWRARRGTTTFAGRR